MKLGAMIVLERGDTKSQWLDLETECSNSRLQAASWDGLGCLCVLRLAIRASSLLTNLAVPC